MRLKQPDLDENATFAGILLGLVIGALYALLNIRQRGAVRRRDLTQFGAGTAELEMNDSINEAKLKAKARLDGDN